MNDTPFMRTLKIFIGLMIIAITASYWPGILPQNLLGNLKQKTPQDFFSGILLEAKAAYVYDLSTQKVLFAKNENEGLPLASLTKIMTAFTALNLAPDTTVVSIDPASIMIEGDSGLLKNEDWNLKKLLEYTLVASSNDGATAVASAISPSFVSEMNRQAQVLGLKTMHFNNPSGLDVNETEAGAYGSARDVASLLTKAVAAHPEVFEATRYASFETASIANVIHKTKNTDELVNEIPGLIAGKTGYSDLAGGNLAVIFDAGFDHPLAVVVLGSTSEGRFNDVKQLVAAAVKYCQNDI